MQQCVHTSELFDKTFERMNRDLPTYFSMKSNRVYLVSLFVIAIVYGLWGSFAKQEMSVNAAKITKRTTCEDYMNEVGSALYKVNKLQRKLHELHVTGSAIVSATPAYMSCNPMIFPSSDSLVMPSPYGKGSSLPSPRYNVAASLDKENNKLPQEINRSPNLFTTKIKSDDTTIKQAFKASVLQALEARQDGLKEQDNKPEISSATKITLRYKDITRTDREGRSFKRVFIPGRGWVSMKAIEEEEAVYGSDSIVSL